MLTAAAACGDGSVPVRVPTEFGAAAVCRELAWPVSLGELVARKTSPSDPAIAAWGDPPITLRCGVTKPSGLTPTARLLRVDGVDWLPEQRSAGYVFTTVGRQAFIEVAVPSAYAPETGVLTDLAPAITSAVPVVTQ